MAQNSLNIYVDADTKDTLNTILKGVVENIQVGAVSEAIKNRQGSGTPEAGTVRYKRFKNATLEAKGTARAAGKGVALLDENVDINLNDDKEIVEELQIKDVKLFGVAGMVAKRAENHAKRVIAYLDRKFFTTAKSAGTAYSGVQTDYDKVLDELIVAAKETSSDYIDGIDAEDLVIVVDGAARKALKNKMDQLPLGTNAHDSIIGRYDGVDVYESNRLGSGVHMFVMLKGSVAEPWFMSEYEAEKIPLDDAVAVENFLYCGCGALNPEAIYYFAETISG